MQYDDMLWHASFPLLCGLGDRNFDNQAVMFSHQTYLNVLTEDSRASSMSPFMVHKQILSLVS